MGYNIYSDCYAGCFLSIIFLKLEEYSNTAIDVYKRQIYGTVKLSSEICSVVPPIIPLVYGYASLTVRAGH